MIAGVPREVEVGPYNHFEETAMLFWQTDAACVRSLKTFRIMPWPYKALDLGVIFAPTLVTMIAYMDRGDGPLDVIWGVAAVLYWLIYAVITLALVRGYFAELKGVPPSLPGPDPGLHRQRATLILLIVMIVIFGTAGIVFHMSHPIPLRGHNWSSQLILPTMFIQHVSAYARGRFWDLSFE